MDGLRVSFQKIIRVCPDFTIKVVLDNGAITGQVLIKSEAPIKWGGKQALQVSGSDKLPVTQEGARKCVICRLVGHTGWNCPGSDSGLSAGGVLGDGVRDEDLLEAMMAAYVSEPEDDDVDRPRSKRRRERAQRRQSSGGGSRSAANNARATARRQRPGGRPGRRRGGDFLYSVLSSFLSSLVFQFSYRFLGVSRIFLKLRRCMGCCLAG